MKMLSRILVGLGISSLAVLLLLSTFPAKAVSTSRDLCTFPNGTLVLGGTRDSSSINPGETYVSAADIINPQPGQFANYSHSYYSNATAWSGWWNMSYNEYAQPHIINTTQAIVRPLAPNGTYWCTVDTTTRWVTDTNPTFWWNQSWYVPWIETNITVGSTINLWHYTAQVVGSETLYALGKYVDCWVVNSTLSEKLHYDKGSGLLVKYITYAPGMAFDLILNATNIPVGLKLSTMVYFNLNPNPASVGGVVTLKGILIDQFSKPLANENVKLYARPLVGSWTYITSTVTNVCGIFTWQATIPSVPKGTYIFAVYYPGSIAYESTYNFAILAIQ